MFNIDRFDFELSTISDVRKLKHDGIDMGNNWPIVYIINNKKDAYVGETVSAARRMEQHLKNEKRQSLTEIRIISDSNFNKSVILDLESFLIKYLSADGKYTLQNGNGGISNHNYYDKDSYKKEFVRIWEELRKNNVAKKSIVDIENSELFKYSPYKTLGKEQFEVMVRILKEMANRGTEIPLSFVVRGGAGTGKTILAVYLLKYLADLSSPNRLYNELEDETFSVDEAEAVLASEGIRGIEKIGIVIPQKALQSSLKRVFKQIDGLCPDMVLTPYEVVKEYKDKGEKFDLLLVDESHRLKCRNKGHLSNYKTFDQCNRELNLDKEGGNELDWLLLCSKHQIFFRDEKQKVRPCDIDDDVFVNTIEDKYSRERIELLLETQWRCQGGVDYTDYVMVLLNGSCSKKRQIENYDFRLYENCAEMIKAIREKETEIGLCRVAAGYAWKWDRNNVDELTIEIQGERYCWNKTYKNWIESDGAKKSEIGCIHTLQGYDLNYAGIIIGSDLKYDLQNNRVYADKECYFDQQGKSGVANDEKALREYIINIYSTLMTRGIKGTYLYVCDDGLREYFKRFVEVY